jgi:hypothetical protein
MSFIVGILNDSLAGISDSDSTICRHCVLGRVVTMPAAKKKPTWRITPIP